MANARNAFLLRLTTNNFIVFRNEVKMPVKNIRALYIVHANSKGIFDNLVLFSALRDR